MSKKNIREFNRKRKAGLVTGFLANKCPLWVLASTHIEVEVSDVFFCKSGQVLTCPHL